MNARRLVFGLAFLSAAAASGAPLRAAAAPLSTDVLATVRGALTALDAGKRATFVESFASDATIIDEISPFRFDGSGAAGAWFDRLVAVNHDNAITAERTTAAVPRAGSVEGDSAYAVVPVRIDYRQHAKAVVENGAWTFALKKVDGTWKIAAAAFAPAATR